MTFEAFKTLVHNGISAHIRVSKVLEGLGQIIKI
ncbi:hypothetical protein PEDI_05820 [Persicobacter diffluens]|uniref:Uncharacterized protein n=1 Tax=Persicobacter diffluens TaxID=981 RepID=A0AAN4VWE8_9BACT|nr:hypothetical protein PEDI_05820 [Persicobacter diffluens]